MFIPSQLDLNPLMFLNLRIQLYYYQKILFFPFLCCLALAFTFNALLCHYCTWKVSWKQSLARLRVINDETWSNSRITKGFHLDVKIKLGFIQFSQSSRSTVVVPLGCPHRVPEKKACLRFPEEGQRKTFFFLDLIKLDKRYDLGQYNWAKCHKYQTKIRIWERINFTTAQCLRHRPA